MADTELGSERSPLQWDSLIVSVLATGASVLPAFLTGATAVQLMDDLGFGATGLGLAVASFFGAGVVGSAALGRLGEQLGAPRALTLGLSLTLMMNLVIAAGARSWITLALPLVVAGLANALSQTAANLLLGQTAPEDRKIFSVSVKQAGMPSATLLAGLAVPLLAETVGWRWSYIAAAILATVALVVVSRYDAEVAIIPRVRPRPDLDRTTLLLLAAAVAFGAILAGALASWTVSSAQAAGIAPGLAGLLLAVGSAIGITARLVIGAWADRSRRPTLPVVAALLTLGGVGLLILAAGTPTSAVLGTVVGFGTGWAWPGLFNGTVVRANPSAPGAATGITQTGTYIGAVIGPVLMGVLVDGPGYTTGWVVISLAALISAALMLAANRRLPPP